MQHERTGLSAAGRPGSFTAFLAKQGDPDEQIKAASKVLTLAGGRQVDIARVCRQVGAEMALELVHQAQRIARKG
jgi:hypothetical protein